MRRAFIGGTTRVSEGNNPARIRVYFMGFVLDTDGGIATEFGVPPDVNYSVTFDGSDRMSRIRTRATNQLSAMLGVSAANIQFLEW